jgi:hypothetical protein
MMSTDRRRICDWNSLSSCSLLAKPIEKVCKVPGAILEASADTIEESSPPEKCLPVDSLSCGCH